MARQSVHVKKIACGSREDWKNYASTLWDVTSWQARQSVHVIAMLFWQRWADEDNPKIFHYDICIYAYMLFLYY